MSQLLCVPDVLGNIQMFMILKKDAFKTNILFLHFSAACDSLAITQTYYNLLFCVNYPEYFHIENPIPEI